jgi:flagellar protein FliL
MAKTAPAVENATSNEADAAPEASPKSNSRRKLILLVAPVVAIAGTAGGLWFTGILPRLLGMQHAEKHEDASKPPTPIYIDLPEFVANLNSNPQRPSYVKLTARLEVLKAEDADHVKAALPRLQDLFLTYIREMRPQELRGSAGTYRLREELIARANLAATPARVTDVLFTQMLIQ